MQGRNLFLVKQSDLIETVISAFTGLTFTEDILL